jgi:hypothetical protein
MRLRECLAKNLYASRLFLSADWRRNRQRGSNTRGRGFQQQPTVAIGYAGTFGFLFHCRLLVFHSLIVDVVFT